MERYDIAIIGGGASGLLAAVAAADTANCRVAILERGDRVGRKLLSTGNGRCNLTNLNAAAAAYHGNAAFAQQVLKLRPPEVILDTFAQLGLRTKPDEEGRVYPLCGQAAAVLDTLRYACASRGIGEICGFDCISVRKNGALFTLTAKDGRAVSAHRVILCAGGAAAPKIGGTDAGVKLLTALGHRAIPRRPALAPVDTDPETVRPLKGLRFQGGITLLVDGKPVRSEQGEILFTETGLSGIAVMQCSREAGDALRAKKRVEFSLQLLEDDPSALTGELYERAAMMEERETGDFLTGLVIRRIGQTLCKLAGISPLSKPCGSLQGGEIRALARLLTDWRMPVTAVKGYDSAQVTAGGIDPAQFDHNTMQSRLVPGLYAAGEVLDIDGDCGGFNLQWAWASGMLAGVSAAASLE